MKENIPQHTSDEDIEARRRSLLTHKYVKSDQLRAVQPENDKQASLEIAAVVNSEQDVFEEGPVLDAIFEKARKRVLSVQPELEEFESARSQTQLQEAREKVRRKKHYIETHNTEKETHQHKLSTITEALFTDGVSRYKWLGEGMESYVVSLYDDYYNYIDGVVRFSRKQEEFEGFAVDLHCGLDEETLQNKFNHLVKNTIDGKMSALDYLLDSNEEPLPPIEIPKFIIAIPAKQAKELFALWHANNTEALKNHPIKNLVMQQVAAQADALYLVAKRNGQDSFAEMLARVVSYINNTAVSNRSDLKQALFDEFKNPITKRIRNMITKAEYEQTKKAA